MLYSLIVVMVLASGTKQVTLQSSLTKGACNKALNQLSSKFASVPEVKFVCK